jgi:N-methylhydantoinase A/oxoprolinase/acetone carboxylase beta subunit
VVSAVVGPVMSRYLDELAARLRAVGITAEIQVMDSAGDVMTASRAAALPVATVESGGAAGVLAAGLVGRAAGAGDVISFDMGGTTAKAGIVRDGRPSITHDFQVGGKGSFGGARAGTGIPLKLPVVDLAEVGAGGGSIASVDGGILRVGPRSAGADPGPACYGRGGTEPTVTDADLVLGYLDPDFFLGGRMRLDVAAARRAIEARVAPSVIRTPISRVRWLTLYEITPKRPIAASSTPRSAKAARTRIVKRGSAIDRSIFSRTFSITMPRPWAAPPPSGRTMAANCLSRAAGSSPCSRTSSVICPASVAASGR